jgi:hypothetical protein
MSGYYDDCFDHITDPVQRNSVRQQWLQMVDGGLSIADVRMLLDKYPDFRFVIGRWISTKPESLGFGDNTIDRLKEFVATLPEFKDVFDKYVSQLVSSDQYRQGELKKLATIFPQFKQVTEQSIKRIKEDEEKRRKDDELRIIRLMSEQNEREEAGRWWSDTPY